jgi:REP element-mobilizing transposase RayT
MPRQARKLSESKIYHVMIRGNEKKDIFLDNEDKIRFIDILCEKNKSQTYVVYAYCLMDNHVHLLLNEASDEISRIMKRINISYAYYFNKKYGRIGHLFQDRFKSEAIDTDSYLLSAVRYIHNNPVKAGIVQNVAAYKWSSYNLYIDQHGQDWIVDKDLILKQFSDERESAIQLFIVYSNVQGDEQFIELPRTDEVKKTIQSETQARHFIASYLVNYNISLEELKSKANINLRRNLTTKLKSDSSLSIRQIAHLLGIDRNVVQRNK